MFELEPEQIQQNAELVLSQVHPDDRHSLDDSIAISATTLQPWVWEGRFLNPSEKLKWFSGASRPEKLANGDILWDGLLMDITERKQTEAALAKRERYLAILVEVQRRLLADDTDGNCYTHILEPLGKLLVLVMFTCLRTSEIKQKNCLLASVASGVPKKLTT